VYARTSGGKVYSFEPSGGLIDGALVMNDFETNSYWFIMSHECIAGEAKGKTLKELPVGRKMRWSQWVGKHPKTLVLSVNGRQDIPGDPYANYFASDQGFRGLQARDKRLPGKASVYAVQLGQRKIAVPFSAFEGGALIPLGDGEQLFLFRPKGAHMFQSSLAFRGHELERDGDVIRDAASGARFNSSRGEWAGPVPTRVHGFDTFWISWSLAHPETELLAVAKPATAKKRYY
jgi:hypothetical protein